MNDTLIRWGGSRAVVSLSLKIIVILLLVGGVPLLAFWPFGKTHAPTVEVYDEANVLQDDGTASSLENLRFREDVKLVVVTLDTGYGDNFNSAVLAYARQQHPEWISTSNPNYWADGTVILGVSPKGRWTGCYFGEDVKVDLAIQQEIQDAGKDSFRQGLWAPGVERMAARTADVIGRPIPSDTAAVIISGIGAIGGLALGVVMLVRRSDAREAFTRARRHYTQVTTDYEGTQIKAGLIPTDDAHGAQILARFAWFEDRYAELTRAFYDFGEPRRAEWFAWDRKPEAERLEVRAAALDSLDDAISNASDLLTMSQSWREAWRNEQGPVREDLASFRKLCSSVQAKGELNITQERFNAIANPGNRLVNNLVTAADTLAGPSRFGLELKRGLFTAQVQSRVPLDSWWADAVPGRADEPLVFSSSLAVVADSWNASSSKGDEVRSVASRVAKGRRLMPWDAMVRLARLGKTDGVGDAVRNASAEQMGRLNRLDLDTGFELIHAPITASIHTLGRGDAHANPGRRFDYH